MAYKSYTIAQNELIAVLEQKRKQLKTKYGITIRRRPYVSGYSNDKASTARIDSLMTFVKTK